MCSDIDLSGLSGRSGRLVWGSTYLSTISTSFSFPFFFPLLRIYAYVNFPLDSTIFDLDFCEYRNRRFLF